MANKNQDIFSKDSTKKAVLAHALHSPVTLSLSAIGILGSSAAVLFNLGSAGLAMGLSGLGLGVGSFCYQYFFKRDALAAQHVDKIRQQLKDQRQTAMIQIKTDLNSLAHLPGAEEFTEQGSAQFEMAQQRYQNLLELLDRKFESHELAYGRYVATTEQVYLSVVDNLQQVVDTLKSIATVNPAYIIKRLTTLKGLKQPSAADTKELETLRQRQLLRNQQLERVNELLTHNEEAMTVLDKTATAIARISTTAGMAKHSIEEAMADLVSLAERAQAYHRNQ